MTSSTYAASEDWRRYQAFFPESMRCTEKTTPREEWWSWSGIDVHLDRLAAPESPIKVIVLHGAGAYGRVMAPAAVIAHAHGWETVSPDLPGYGLTRGAARALRVLAVDRLRRVAHRRRDRARRKARRPLRREPRRPPRVPRGGTLAARRRPRRDDARRPREAEVASGFARTKVLGSAGLWLLDKTKPITDGLPLADALHVEDGSHLERSRALRALRERPARRRELGAGAVPSHAHAHARPISSPRSFASARAARAPRRRSHDGHRAQPALLRSPRGAEAHGGPRGREPHADRAPRRRPDGARGRRVHRQIAEATMIHHVIFAMGIGRDRPRRRAVRRRERLVASCSGFRETHDNATARLMARFFGVRDVGLGVLVFWSLAHPETLAVRAPVQRADGLRRSGGDHDPARPAAGHRPRGARVGGVRAPRGDRLARGAGAIADRMLVSARLRSARCSCVRSRERSRPPRARGALRARRT